MKLKWPSKNNAITVYQSLKTSAHRVSVEYSRTQLSDEVTLRIAARTVSGRDHETMTHVPRDTHVTKQRTAMRSNFPWSDFKKLGTPELSYSSSTSTALSPKNFEKRAHPSGGEKKRRNTEAMETEEEVTEIEELELLRGKRYRCNLCMSGTREPIRTKYSSINTGNRRAFARVLSVSKSIDTYPLFKIYAISTLESPFYSLSFISWDHGNPLFTSNHPR